MKYATYTYWVHTAHARRSGLLPIRDASNSIPSPFGIFLAVRTRGISASKSSEKATGKSGIKNQNN